MRKKESTSQTTVFSLSMYPDEIRQLEQQARLNGVATYKMFCREIIRMYLTTVKEKNGEGE